jgi:hypothetical protein
VQIVRTEFTVYLDLLHSAEMLGTSLCKTAHSNDSGVASACGQSLLRNPHRAPLTGS